MDVPLEGFGRLDFHIKINDLSDLLQLDSSLQKSDQRIRLSKRFLLRGQKLMIVYF